MVLLPKYIEVEKAEKSINEIWKNLFMKIIDELNSNFKFELYDFKSCEYISEHMEYYEDLTHLNHNGAAVFTDHLSEIIKDKMEWRKS